jgi:adenylosuccinate lyase
MIKDLYLNTDIITQKVESKFEASSSYVLHKLLPSFESTREELYALIQEASFESKNREDFVKALTSKGLDMGSLPLHSVKEMYKDQTEKIFLRVKEIYKLT